MQQIWRSSQESRYARRIESITKCNNPTSAVWRLIGCRGFQGAIDYDRLERGSALLQFQAHLIEGVADGSGWTRVQERLGFRREFRASYDRGTDHHGLLRLRRRLDA